MIFSKLKTKWKEIVSDILHFLWEEHSQLHSLDFKG